MICPKCAFEQSDGSAECFRCGLVFSKFEALQRRREQMNSRYSPSADDAADPAPNGGTLQEAPPQTLSPVVQAPPPPLAPAQNQVSEAQPTEPPGPETPTQLPPAPAPQEPPPWLARQLESLQTVLGRVLQGQESLFRTLDSHSQRFGDLFRHVAEMRESVDQRLLAFQGQIEPAALAVERMRDSISFSDELAALRKEYQDFSGRMALAAPVEKAERELAGMGARVERVEALRGHVEALAKKGAEAADALARFSGEIVLVKTEVNALRAEVQSVIEERMPERVPVQDFPPDPRPPAPAPPPDDSRIRAVEERLDGLGVRINESRDTAQQRFSEASAGLGECRAKLAEAEKAIHLLAVGQAAQPPIADEIRRVREECEGRFTSVSGEVGRQRDEMLESARQLETQGRYVAEMKALVERLKKAVAE